jgi:photosystem II stability/assembly factor-like uncharacterized protein
MKTLIFLILSFFAATAWSQWVKVSNGFNNADIFTIRVKGDNIFAGTYGGGVFKSTNNGLNWSQTSLDNYIIDAMLIKDSAIVCGSNGKGIFISSDNGNSWFPSNYGMTDLNVLCLSGFGGNIYSGTVSGKIFISSDNGASWCNLGTGLPNSAIMSVHAYSKEILFAGTFDYGVYRSTDSGQNWYLANTGMQEFSITALSSFSNIILAGTIGQNISDIYYSTNLGNSWLPGFRYYDMHITSSFAVKGNSIFAGNGDGLLRSADTAKRWMPTCLFCIDGYIRALDVSGNEIYAGTSKECLITADDGINWTHSKNGLTNIFVTCMDVCNKKIFAGSNNGLYRSSDNGNHWTIVDSIPANEITDIFVRGNLVFVSDLNARLFRSTNFGETWENVFYQTYIGNIWSFAMDGNNNLYIGAGDGVFKSSYNGNTLTKISDSWNLSFPHVRTVVVNGNSIYAGTESNGVFTSGNLGTTWQQTNTGLTDTSITSLAMNGNTLFAGTANTGIFKSTDSGLHWNSSNCYYLPVASVNMLYAINGIIFAGLDNNGVIFSSDNGVNWAQNIEGMGNRAVQSFIVANNYAFAGTYGNSVMRQPYSDLIRNNITVQNLIFDLYQNYPNPFNQTTAIRYGLSKTSNVNISIFDITGRKIEEFINKIHNAGSYLVNWNGENYPSGIYFYRMTIGNSSITKRFCLVK